MNRRLSAYLILLVVSIIWGVAGPVIKFTLSDFPPLIFLTYRFAISSVVGLIILALTKPKLPKSTKDTGLVLAHSLLAVPIGLGLLFFGFDKTTSLTGTLLTALAPIVTVVSGMLLLRERVTKIERIGISIAFGGSLITIVGPMLNGLRNGALVGSVEGNLLIIASLLVDTASTLLVKPILRRGVSASTLTHVAFIIGLITIAPIAIAFHGSSIVTIILAAPISAHIGVWFMALLSGTLAYALRNYAIKSIEVSEAAVFSYLYPLWAAPLAVYWLGEKVTTPFLLGGTIIALGVVIAEYKRRHKRR